MSNTERVQYRPDEKTTRFGTVQRRFTADDNGTNREFAVVRFGTLGDDGPEYFMATADLDAVGYTASLEVEYDDMKSPEDAALSLIEWVANAGPGDLFYVHAAGDDGATYTVAVEKAAEGFTAEISGVRAGGRK